MNWASTETMFKTRLANTIIAGSISAFNHATATHLIKNICKLLWLKIYLEDVQSQA